MEDSKKFDKTLLYYILGGAAAGAIAGYIAKKVGLKNIINVLKAKNIIPENIVKTFSEFTARPSQDDADFIKDLEEEDKNI